ncbi:hypothetical protein IGJ19_002801 [Enterococcus sp. DIV1368b]|uniref:Uncharacterized protein n=2 Tax=Enterococcus mundtii TaxID=53346 RepID=A0A1L8V0F5_ENTMU|nr:hypothetical protein [Enterococcus mundtii]MZZ62127.1 hypothetical protein [Enterococcus mundtii]MZZ69207.1 hypothetical protein [Enterococcus mundtii]MZZ98028.1 hypothetical protein [Enterococcus mundtii]NAA00978.1 hypothetical protein [Enterococcus mundtii]
MMIEEYFKEVGLTMVELPVEWVDEQLIYRGLIKELPTINAEANSRAKMQQQLAETYRIYREQLLLESEEEKETTTNLTSEQLLRYYDGETFDGFSLFDQLPEE